MRLILKQCGREHLGPVMIVNLLCKSHRYLKSAEDDAECSPVYKWFSLRRYRNNSSLIRSCDIVVSTLTSGFPNQSDMPARPIWQHPSIFTAQNYAISTARSVILFCSPRINAVHRNEV